jgi:predicted DNA-binding transcriptional regulator AlpA
MTSDTLLTAAQVAKMIGYRHRSSVWRLTQEGLFPKPLQISRGIKRWRRSAVIEYMNRLTESPAKAAKPACAIVPGKKENLAIQLGLLVRDLESAELLPKTWTIERKFDETGKLCITIIAEMEARA